MKTHLRFNKYQFLTVHGMHTDLVDNVLAAYFIREFVIYMYLFLNYL